MSPPLGQSWRLVHSLVVFNAIVASGRAAETRPSGGWAESCILNWLVSILRLQAQSRLEQQKGEGGLVKPALFFFFYYINTDTPIGLGTSEKTAQQLVGWGWD